MSEKRPPPMGGMELPARVVSALVLGITAIAALVMGGIFFAVFVALGAVAALREWHRLVGPGDYWGELGVSGLAIVAAIFCAQTRSEVGAGFLIVGLGSVGAAAVAWLRRPQKLWPLTWNGLGAIYVGIPVLSLVLLRAAENGAFLVGGLFVAVWMADTGAYFCGRLIGGPKLAPELSPNKTWAGFLGGTMAAGMGEAFYISLLGGQVLSGAALGLLLAVAGHGGDLFESWVKRQFHTKNTGRLIPGHGGVLDRIDSLLFAAPACAALIFLAGFEILQSGFP